MKEIAKFFWEQWVCYVQMDMANKINGNPTHYWVEAEKWTDAFKQTLSKNKRQEFEKEWNKLNDALQEFHNASPKKLNGLKSPMGLE